MAVSEKWLVMSGTAYWASLCAKGFHFECEEVVECEVVANICCPNGELKVMMLENGFASLADTW